MFAPEFYSFS